MRSLSRRSLPLLLTAFLCIVGLSAPAAKAIIQDSKITTPSSPTYLLADKAAEGAPIAIEGEAVGMTEVDIRCYFRSSGSTLIAEKIPVDGEGKFHTTAAPGKFLAVSTLCRLRAVPTGTEPTLTVSFNLELSGPLIAPSHFDVSSTSYSASSSSMSGAIGVDTADECGLEATLAKTSSLEASAELFYCVGGVNDAPTNKAPNTQIDGAPAYGPSAAKTIEFTLKSGALPGAPQLSVSGKSFNASNGDLSVTEHDPFAKCAPEANTEPPTIASCTSFAPLGVTLERTWTIGSADHTATLLDVWRSTDGQPHNVSASYTDILEQEEEGGGLGVFRFPGTGAFASTSPAETVALPGGPGTILYKYDSTTPEGGDGIRPQGAIVYDRPPSGPLKVILPTSKAGSETSLEAPYTLSIPAGGVAAVRMTFVQAFALAEVETQAASALASFAPSISIVGPANGATVEPESATVTVSGTAADSGALAGVSVNGVAATIGATGTWSASVPVKAGANTITATATDQAGLTKSAAITVTYKIPPGKAKLMGAVTTNKGNVSFILACTGAPGATCAAKDSLVTVERRRGSKILGLLASRIKKKSITVASGTQTIKAGKSVKVTLKLNTTGKTLLKRFHKLPARLTVTIATNATPAIVSATNVTVTPPKRKRKH